MRSFIQLGSFVSINYDECNMHNVYLAFATLVKCLISYCNGCHAILHHDAVSVSIDYQHQL